LPATRQDLVNSRLLKHTRTILDHVEDMVIVLWDTPEFKSLCDAIFPSQTKEGSFILDDGQAAVMIRNLAKERDVPELMDQKLDAIVHALRIVLKRYGQGRKQRRGDESPQSEGGGGD